MTYQHKETGDTVDALKLQHPIAFTEPSAHGLPRHLAGRGDWLVTGADSQWLATNEDFEKAYEAAGVVIEAPVEAEEAPKARKGKKAE